MAAPLQQIISPHYALKMYLLSFPQLKIYKMLKTSKIYPSVMHKLHIYLKV